MADGNPPVTGTSNKITAGTVPNWKPSVGFHLFVRRPRSAVVMIRNACQRQPGTIDLGSIGPRRAMLSV